MTEDWEQEEIPQTSRLYYRMHKSRWPQNEDPRTYIPAGGFVEKPEEGCGMSTDWDKYSTPAESRERAKEPEMNAVIELLVSEVEGIGGQRVIHEPVRSNRAHSSVYGMQKGKTRIRREYQRIAKVVIAYTDQL